MYKKLNTEEQKAHDQYFVAELNRTASNFNSSSKRELPFFHTCKAEVLRSIFMKKAIVPKKCDVFGKDLIYLFYGKPAFRVTGPGDATTDLGRFPVSFVVQLDEATTTVSGVFPFDTGALAGKIYANVMGEETNPAKFEIGTTLDSVNLFVTGFYGTDKNYFSRKPRVTVGDIGAFSFELRRTLSLVEERTSKSYDNRSYTLEVPVTNSIKFDNDSIKAILLPSDFMGDVDFDDFLYNNNIDTLTYSLEQSDPEHITPLLQKLAEDYLKSRKIL